MGKLIVIAVLLGAGYWYWNGPYNQGRPTSEQAQLRENAADMQRCMRREKSMEGVGGMAGIGGMATDGEQLCAEKLGLYQDEGQWHKISVKPE